MGCPAALASCWLLWTVWPDHFWDGGAANPKPLDQEQLNFSRNLWDKTVWVWGQSTRHSCSTWQDPMGTLRFKRFGTLATWFTLSRNANGGTQCLRWFWTFWFGDQLCGIFCRFGGSVGQWNFLPVGQGVFWAKHVGVQYLFVFQRRWHIWILYKQFCWADGFLEWQDKFGRARVLTWTLVPYTLATACTAISQGIFSFAIFQFVAAAFITAASRLCL